MDLMSLVQEGANSFLYLAAVGLLLGSLHGLEPGHSKTMMAAFIVAVRGTPFQAVLLGLSAALSHSIIVWLLAGLALFYGDRLIGEKLEPYLIMGSGLIIAGIGAVMLARALLQRAESPALQDHHHRDHHDHEHDHDHGHTGHHHHGDAHARAHAMEIGKRFADGRATNLQTIGFGLVGGLIPCPAAITVLLLCLGVGQFWMGAGLVASFSIGLAVTLVAVGMAAALGLRYARNHSAGFNRFLASAPYISGGLILLVGCYMTLSGYLHFGS
jgi:nickel/cobalt exporter